MRTGLATRTPCRARLFPKNSLRSAALMAAPSTHSGKYCTWEGADQGLSARCMVFVNKYFLTITCRRVDFQIIRLSNCQIMALSAVTGQLRGRVHAEARRTRRRRIAARRRKRHKRGSGFYPAKRDKRRERRLNCCFRQDEHDLQDCGAEGLVHAEGFRVLQKATPKAFGVSDYGNKD